MRLSTSSRTANCRIWVHSQWLGAAAISILLLAAPALAQDPIERHPGDERLIGLLTCSADVQAGDLAALVQSSALRSVGDDGFELIRPVSASGICVQRARVTAGFGVVIVLGQLCDPDAEALLRGFRKDFRSTPDSLPAGYLFMGKSASGEAMVFRGTATPPPKPDVTSDAISYSCAQGSGGTQ